MTHTAEPPRRGGFVPGQRASARRRTDEANPDGLSPEVARQIDENLRLLYRKRVEQELPEDLQALVTQLRKGDGQ